MKKNLFTLILIMSIATSQVFAQHKSKTISTKKKATTSKEKTNADSTTPTGEKEREPESPLNTSTAGKYAKDFGNRMYNTRPLYGDRHTGYFLNILSWKTLKGNEGKYMYAIPVEISWKEGTGGLFSDWKEVSYKGVIVCDEFGCAPVIFIKEKKETSVFGIAKRVSKLEQKTIDVMTSADEMFNGIQYQWSPQGCLE